MVLSEAETVELGEEEMVVAVASHIQLEWLPG
jgi:hypothetical protein